MLTHKAVILQGNEEQIKTRLTRQVIVLGIGVREKVSLGILTYCP
jgi:hypothetical protein